jgi:hypothetical protein
MDIPKQKFNQTSKAYIFNKKSAPVIDEVNEDEDEDMKSSSN